ncbi:acetate--CoA ligase family protein [Candidatus Poriferisodalis sp.]|uniref:acetate--CoA ligase family protein n=1 Tax=Candidatus Poriferisodalis sp. TaxID=3101277 RepID=UPI003B596516
MSGRLDRLLRPRSLAFIGGTAAELAIEACRSFGFDGEMWAVNPRHELRGAPTVASVAELPGVADAAFVAVARDTATEVVRELAAAGTGAAVCYASGFAETGDAGAAAQRELVEAAAGMPLVGPNCYGTLSAVTGAALWPDVHGLARCERGVALVSQSGNVAVNLTMARRGLAVAHVLALGNQADVGLAESLETLVADPAVTGVGLYLEAVDDIDRFAAAMDAAHQRSLPVVALKLGVTEASGAIAVTHTASLVGSDTAYDALFRRLGVHRVHTLPELLDTLSVLVDTGPLQGNRLVSLSCSGGEAALVADRSRGRDLSFPAFSPEHRDRVAAALDHRVAVTNPLDYHTFIWGDAARLRECFTAVLCHAHPAAASSTEPSAEFSDEPLTEGPGEPSVDLSADPPFDAAMLVLDLPAVGLDRSRWWPTLDAFGAACDASGTPGVVVASLAENLPDEARTRAGELGLCACSDIDTALGALEAAAAFGRSLAAVASTPPPPLLAPAHSARPASKPQPRRSDGDADATGSDAAVRTETRLTESVLTEAVLTETRLTESVLTEFGAKRRLAEVGISVPRGLLVTAAEAVAAAMEIGLPVVVKASGVVHKSDIGAVAIGMADLDDVAAAAARLGALGDGTVTVEEHVAAAVAELLVSIRSEPPVGMLLTLGAGGTLVEMLDDTAALLLPTDPADVRAALRSLRIWPLLAGHRGRPPAALDAVVSVVSALATLVSTDRSITEVEINPVLVTRESAVAVDALMTVARPGGDEIEPVHRRPDRP